MMKSIHKTGNTASRGRRGNAAVECALVVPLLVLIVLGAIDVGQYVNVAQTVNNASREGARRASKDTVTDVSEVKASVRTYLANAFPNVSSTAMDQALNVTVQDASGTALTGDLTPVPTGSKIAVKVEFQYDAVRWTSSFAAINGKALTTRTVMRRE